MIQQPKQFSYKYAGMFQDSSVADAYINRQPYVPETFEILAGLIDKSVAPCRILDAGCGLGQMASGLLPHADQIDAVDFSAAMVAAGKSMSYGNDPRINWIVGPIEEVSLQPPYALIVAAASLHWMPWDKTLPRFERAISANGYLALVEGHAAPDSWAEELKPLFAHYSMNRDFEPYNMLTVADTLQQHDLFKKIDVLETQLVPFRRSVEAMVESTHAQNGFSRDRMDADLAAEFDRKMRDVLLKHCPDGEVEQQIGARVIVGKPLAAEM